jgi:hypothetical protein
MAAPNPSDPMHTPSAKTSDAHHLPPSLTQVPSRYRERVHPPAASQRLPAARPRARCFIPCRNSGERSEVPLAIAGAPQGTGEVVGLSLGTDMLLALTGRCLQGGARSVMCVQGNSAKRFRVTILGFRRPSTLYPMVALEGDRQGGRHRALNRPQISHSEFCPPNPVPLRTIPTNARS